MLALCLPLAASAQVSLSAHGARNGAMGGCFLPDTASRHVALTLRQPYLMPELADKLVTLGWPVGKSGSLGAGYLHQGNSTFHRQRLAASYALRAASRLRVGAEIGYSLTATANPRYQPLHGVSAAATAQLSAGRNLLLTLLVGAQTNTQSTESRILLQAAHRPIPQLLTVVEAERTDVLRLRMGVEYAYGGAFFFRTGLATAPLSASFGIGIRYRHYRFDLGTGLHSALGLTPHTSIALWL